MGNRHVCTSSVVLHKVSGSLHAVDMRKYTNVQLVLFCIRYQS